MNFIVVVRPLSILLTPLNEGTAISIMKTNVKCDCNNQFGRLDLKRIKLMEISHLDNKILSLILLSMLCQPQSY